MVVANTAKNDENSLPIRVTGFGKDEDGPGSERPLGLDVWINYPLRLLALWGNKNWPPSMKVKKLKIF